MAPRTGIEPVRSRLTGECSTKLSYREILVGAARFELATCRLKVDCSNQLSYALEINEVECGAKSWARTSGHQLFKLALYQLSYLCKHGG